MSWIIDEIVAQGGEVFFDEYMNLVLYHPIHGYYSGDEPRYGREGDFLTAPTASEWYSRVMTRLLVRVFDQTGPLRLIDVASGDGAVISGVLETLGPRASNVLAGVVSVERSPAMRRLELYDALPVARVVGVEKSVEELAVGVQAGELVWRRRPPRREVEAYFVRHGVELEEGQVAEANLGAEPLHTRLLEAAGQRGLSLVLDYGYEAKRLFNPRGRRGGSLSTFRRHELGRDPLISPGEVDLTAHVNWDDLRDAAAHAAWREIGLWPLAEFLVRAGIAEELEDHGLGMEADLDATTITARQEVKRLLDPEGMGSDLKMLVQAKGEMVDIAQSVLSLPQ
ncbi:MAG: SAM-dependent methyltransferase [Acidobacteria bacterium]|nr:SAM-dependent methyltransferase [Candidatus Sulfomarinibacter kjeldsenii]